MSWGQVAAAGINAVGSLLGGGGGQEDIYKQWKYQGKAQRHYGTNIRESAERSGFNPLTLVGNVPSSSFAPGASGGGNAAAPLASFGAALADHFTSAQDKAETAEAAEERTRKAAETQLDRIQREARNAGGAGEVVNRTLNPRKVDVVNSPVSESGPAMAPYDRDREMEKLTATDGPGVTTIDNDYLPGPIHVPGDGGEPWGIDELLSATVTGAPQVAWQFGRKLGKAYDGWTADRAETVQEQTPERTTYGVGFNRDQVDEYRSRRRSVYGD